MQAMGKLSVPCETTIIGSRSLVKRRAERNINVWGIWPTKQLAGKQSFDGRKAELPKITAGCTIVLAEQPWAKKARARNSRTQRPMY